MKQKRFGGFDLFELILTKTFAQELKKLEKNNAEKIKGKLRSCVENPWNYFQRLKGHNLFKLRIGKYRVISMLSHRGKKIYLLSVKHRKKSYRKL